MERGWPAASDDARYDADATWPDRGRLDADPYGAERYVPVGEAELVAILSALRLAGAALERALVAARRIEREPGPLTREFGSALAVVGTTEEDVIRILAADGPSDGTAAVGLPRPGAAEPV